MPKGRPAERKALYLEGLESTLVAGPAPTRTRRPRGTFLYQLAHQLAPKLVPTNPSAARQPPRKGERVNLHYLGQSGFAVTTGEHLFLIDPFLTGNPKAVDDPAGFSPSHIVLTHAHGDHYGDTEAIAKRSGAAVITSFEVAQYLGKKDIRSVGMNIGGQASFPFGSVKYTPAWHSNSLPDGTYAGMPAGVVLGVEGKRIYHAGDTALFSDMALIGRGGLDLAILPIGDFFTMGPDDAVEAVKLLDPKRVITVHYDTFPPIEQDPEAFKRRVENETDAEVIVLRPGERFTL